MLYLLFMYFKYYLRGLNPEQAEMKFLQKAKDLRRYGQHLFAVYVSVYWSKLRRTVMSIN